MIPILYDATETSFTSNGIGRLRDTTRCIVTEERNGIFECEFDYPVTGKWYSEIVEGRIVFCTHDDSKTGQPFVIYRRSAPIDGIVTFNAHHISYRLSYVIMKPFTASGIASTFNALTNASNLMTTNPFTFWTNKSVSGTYKKEDPASVRSILAGEEGSILDVFGTGEYLFDKFSVKLYVNRGADNGVTIRYGKNLTDLTQEIDAETVYNSVVPYYVGNDTHVYGSVVSRAGTQPADIVAVPLDMSSDFPSSVPTSAQLNSKAATYLSNNEPWTPQETIDVDFVALWQTPEYANIAPLERVKLCDTVTVIYTALGVNTKLKVIECEYNVLLDKYNKITLGTPKASFAETILTAAGNMINDSARGLVSYDVMAAAIQNATDLITGGLGGYVVFHYDANGKPTEILIMDDEDEANAIHVIRMNVNGIGFSSNGINGPYTTAWTIDGNFNADFITAGHLSANRIQGGVLTLGGNANGNGTLVIQDANGNTIGTWDNSGINANSDISLSGTIILGSNTTGTQSHITIDYHSFNQIDKNSNSYVTFIDMRNTSGIATVSEFFVADGNTNIYEPSVNLVADQNVKVNGSNVYYTMNGSNFVLTNTPAKGASVQILYTTDSDYAKAYTLGLRSGSVGMMSVAEGKGTTASGYISHAEGNGTIASGTHSHAEGKITTASGESAHAEGAGGTASGIGSHVEGTGCTASGDYSHAEGIGTIASQSASHAQGSYTKAESADETAMGRYNVPGYALSVGKGTSDNARSNALALDWSGNLVIAGNITANGSNLNTSKVSKSGDTMTGTLTRKTTAVDLTTAPGSTQYVSGMTLTDKNDTAYGIVGAMQTTANAIGARFGSYRDVSGTTVYNLVSLIVATDGTQSVTFSNSAAWRDGMGLTGGCKAYLASNATSLTTSWQVYPGTMTSIYNSGAYTITSNYVLVKVAGVYQISGSVMALSGFTANDIIDVTLATGQSSSSVADACQAQLKVANASPYTTISLGPVVVSLSANDKIFMFAKNETGSRGTLWNPSSSSIQKVNWISVVRIG